MNRSSSGMRTIIDDEAADVIVDVLRLQNDRRGPVSGTISSSSYPHRDEKKGASPGNLEHKNAGD